MQYSRFGLAVLLFVSSFSFLHAGAAASKGEGSELDINTAALPGIEQIDWEEEPPNYWKYWTRESAFARSRSFQPLNKNESSVERLKTTTPRLTPLEQTQANQKLTLRDAGVGTLKVIVTVIAIPVVLTGYLGLLAVEGLFARGASFGFG